MSVVWVVTPRELAGTTPDLVGVWFMIPAVCFSETLVPSQFYTALQTWRSSVSTTVKTPVFHWLYSFFSYATLSFVHIFQAHIFCLSFCSQPASTLYCLCFAVALHFSNNLGCLLMWSFDTVFPTFGRTVSTKRRPVSGPYPQATTQYRRVGQTSVSRGVRTQCLTHWSVYQ